MTAMDFRHYMNDIGRFAGIDRLAELAAGISPYRFAYNNPISYSDPSGLFETRFGAWWHRLWNADGGGKIQYDKKTEEYYYLTNTRLDTNGNQGNNVDLVTTKEYGHGSGNLLGGLIQNGNVDSNGNTPLDNYRSWRDNPNYNPGESRLDRSFRLMNSGHIEQMRDAASGFAAGGYGGALKGINNPVPSTVARVVPAHIESTTLGAPGTSEVFVTAAADIKGLSAAQIAERLTIQQSSTGFKVIEFSTPKSGIATPYVNQSPGFVGFGRTAGGAREFIIPNQSIPQSAKIIIAK